MKPLTDIKLERRDVENVFFQSPVNGGVYLGDRLPEHHWDFPTGTWLQRRLEMKREKERQAE